MNKKRYTYKELSRMSLKSLEKVGRELSPALKFTKNHIRSERVRRIMSAYQSEDLQDTVESDKSTVHSSKIPHDHSLPLKSDGQQAVPRERKPVFENLCCDSPSVNVDVESKHGGAREDAGRKVGMTADIALYNQLPQVPHPTIIAVLEMLFETWSMKVGCDKVALTKDQAIELALPWTHAFHLMGITDIIPPWLSVGIMCLWTTANMFAAKAGIARDFAANCKKVENETKDVAA